MSGTIHFPNKVTVDSMGGILSPSFLTVSSRTSFLHATVSMVLICICTIIPDSSPAVARFLIFQSCWALVIPIDFSWSCDYSAPLKIWKCLSLITPHVRHPKLVDAFGKVVLVCLVVNFATFSLCRQVSEHFPHTLSSIPSRHRLSACPISIPFPRVTTLLHKE